jgi:hyperosmotically inducible protein
MTARRLWMLVGVTLCLSSLHVAQAQTAPSASDATAASAAPSAVVTKKQMRKQDRALARAVRNALRKVKGMDVANIQVVSRTGIVTITGGVRDQSQIDASGAAAAHVAGVSRVDNRLTISDPGH